MTNKNKTKNRKILILLLSAVVFIILTAGVITLVRRLNSTPSDNTSPTQTPSPSPAGTPAPTVTDATSITPLPADSKDDYIGLYPAYKETDGLNKYGYIDRAGTFVLEPDYDDAENFSDNLAVVMKKGKYQVITPDGSVIFENDNTINSFRNGMAAFVKVIDNAYLYGYIDTTGNVVIEPQFQNAGNFNEEGLAYVMTPDETYEIIDKSGAVKETFHPEMNNGYVTTYEDGYLIFYDTDTFKYGVRSLHGKTVLEPIYSGIMYLGYDLFAVNEPQLESYEALTSPAAIFNAKGEQLTDYTLYDLYPFEGEYTSAADETSIFFIGKDGKEVTFLPSYDGGGKLTLLGDTIKAEIDSELAYYKKDNTSFWHSETSTVLSPKLKVNRVKFRPFRSVLVYYPQIEGMADHKIQDKVNSELEEIFTGYRMSITKEDMLTVDDTFTASLFHDLLVISMNGYDYYAGAAHGMPLWQHYFIDTVTGEFYDFKDLFVEGSDYEAKINEIIRAHMKKELEKEESMYFEDAFQGISHNPNFYLKDDSLVIYFTPYEIAAYAAGFPEFEIPFDELDGCINKKGAFWRAFHGK